MGSGWVLLPAACTAPAPSCVAGRARPDLNWQRKAAATRGADMQLLAVWSDCQPRFDAPDEERGPGTALQRRSWVRHIFHGEQQSPKHRRSGVLYIEG